MARSETAAKPGEKAARCARVSDSEPEAVSSQRSAVRYQKAEHASQDPEVSRRNAGHWLRPRFEGVFTPPSTRHSQPFFSDSFRAPLTSVRSAFTLIELLIVIAIVAMLAALLLPALKSARDKAYTTACANQLHQINLALVLYQDDYNRCYPPLLYDGTTTQTDPAMSFMKSLPAAGGKGYVCWLWLLYPYHHKPEIYLCPSAKNKSCGWTYGMALGFGSWVSTTGAWSAYCFSGTGTPVGPVRQGNEANTDRKILIFDGRAGILGLSPVGTSGGVPYVMGYGGYQDFQHNGAPNGGPNCLFVDGHVSWLSGFYTWAFNDAAQRWFQPCSVSLP